MQVAGMVRHGKPWTFIAWPPSYCPACRASIPPYRNIPLLSWLLLRGRAKCCGASISCCYPLVELGGGVLTALAAWRFGIGVDGLLAMAFLLILFAASLIDLRRYYLPDILTLPLLWLGLLANLDARFALLVNAVLGAAGGYVALRSLAVAGTAWYGREVMGGGDVKLLAAIGAWLGWQKLPIAFFMACAAGVIFAVLQHWWRQRQRRQRHTALGLANAHLSRRLFGGRFCFGPSLSFAAAIMLLWGDDILLAYWLWVAQ